MPAAVAIVALAYSIASTEDAKRRQKHQLETQAAMEKEAAADEAENIRERGRRIAATQSATLAASGVKLTPDGTPQTILQETRDLTEKDALATLKYGAQRVSLLEQQSANVSAAAMNKNISATLNTASSMYNQNTDIEASSAKSKQATQMDMDTNSGNFIRSKGNKYNLSLMGGDT